MVYNHSMQKVLQAFGIGAVGLAVGGAVLVLEIALAPEHAPQHQQATAAATAPGVTPALGIVDRRDLKHIAEWNLFGTYRPPPEPGAEADRHAEALDADTLPETTLALNLTGVFFDQGTQQARAIIQTNGNREAKYAVGDKLPGGATIESIFKKAVVITHQGKRESIKLPDYEETGAGSPAAAGRVSGPRTAQPLRPKPKKRSSLAGVSS